jgi:hypothetical protein
LISSAHGRPRRRLGGAFARAHQVVMFDWLDGTLAA